MSRLASSSPSRDPYYGKTKHPKMRTSHSSHNSAQSKVHYFPFRRTSLTRIPQVYPRGVSSYLSTFLNEDGDHSADNGSGSDSDDSFFSYSARFASPDLNRSQLPSRLSSDVQKSSRSSSPASLKSYHSASGVLAPRSLRKNSQHHSPTQNVQLTPRRHDMSSGKKQNKIVSNVEKSPPELVAVVSNKRPPSGKSVRSTHSFPSQSRLILSVDTPRPKEKKSAPQLCDAAIQTSPQDHAIGTGLCKRCQNSLASPFTENSFLLEAKSDPLAVSRYRLYAVLGSDSSSPSSPAVPQVTVDSHTQTSGQSSARASALGSTFLSDGSKTDSFASSDALPDDIERLFDRASFSIHGSGNTNSSTSSSIDDPDELRKGLKALLKGRESSQIKSEPIISPPLSPTRSTDEQPLSTWMDKFTSNSSSGPTPIASISGVLFADPFATSAQTTALSDSNRIKYAKSRTVSVQRRKSSIVLPEGLAPPVPVIPENFRQTSIARVAEIQRPPSLARLSSLENGSDLSEIIHPHSPVQVSSGFSPTTGRRISLRPHQDFVFTEPPSACRTSRGPGSGDSTANWVKSGSDSRIQVLHFPDYSNCRKTRSNMHPSENFAPVTIPTIRRPSLWKKISNSSATAGSSSINNSSARPSGGNSKSSQAKPRRKLRRKSQSVHFRRDEKTTSMFTSVFRGLSKVRSDEWTLGMQVCLGTGDMDYNYTAKSTELKQPILTN